MFANKIDQIVKLFEVSILESSDVKNNICRLYLSALVQDESGFISADYKIIAGCPAFRLIFIPLSFSDISESMKESLIEDLGEVIKDNRIPIIVSAVGICDRHILLGVDKHVLVE